MENRTPGRETPNEQKELRNIDKRGSSSNNAGNAPEIKALADGKRPVNMVTPRYIQPPVVTDGDSGASVTHAHTTVPSLQGRSQHGSLYSYVSDRDISQFLRELHGRYEHIYGNEC